MSEWSLRCVDSRLYAREIRVCHAWGRLRHIHPRRRVCRRVCLAFEAGGAMRSVAAITPAAAWAGAPLRENWIRADQNGD